MPRKTRTHYFEAMYHVMLRGNYRQIIFNDDNDRLYFYSLLKQVTEKFNCKIHLFCLMTNHIHLVIEINHVPLWKIVQSFASSYARYINKKNKQSGHLFQGRYKAKLIQDEQYLLNLCYYIHSNPIQAKMVNHIDDYLWSSHPSYLDVLHINIDWLTTHYIHKIIKKRSSLADNCYLEFIKRESLHCIERNICDFDENGILTIHDSINEKIFSKKFDDLSSIKMDDILKVICKNMKIPSTAIVAENHNREVILARSLFIYFAHYYANYQINEIAKFILKNPESISRTMHRHLQLIRPKESMRSILNNIENDLICLSRC
jgi:putative transposase